MCLEIRRAASDDAVAVSRILERAFSPYRRQYTPAAYAATVLDPIAVRDRLQEGPVWVASREGKIVGTVSAILKKDEAHVRGMAVVPEAQGAGIGRALLQRVEAWAGRMGSEHLVLSTTPFLDRAIRMYQQYGFRATTEGPFEMYGTPLHSMERSVNGLGAADAC